MNDKNLLNLEQLKLNLEIVSKLIENKKIESISDVDSFGIVKTVYNISFRNEICCEMDIRSVAIYSEEDRNTFFREKADEAYQIGKGKASFYDPDRDTIIKSDKILNPVRTPRTAPTQTTEDGGAPSDFELPPEQRVR